MRLFLLTALCCAGLSAQTLSFAFHDNTGATSDVALPSAYQFDTTPQGGSLGKLVKITNNSASTVETVLVYVGSSPGSPAANPNFTVTGLNEGNVLAPGGSQYFTLNFTPSATGQLVGYLQVTYLVEQNNCDLSATTTATACQGTTTAVSTLEGTGSAPQIALTYNKGAGNTSLQPSAASRLDFGSISTSATSTLTFTLTNQTSSALATPTVSIQNAVFSSSAFALDKSSLPAAIAANGSVTFTLTFAPGQTGLTTAALLVGTNTYGIQGTGIVVSDIDALAISYVDTTGVRTEPQAATPINFGQLVPGSSAGATLKFTVTNPATSFNAVTVPALAITGANYTLSGAPTLPATIQPNSSVTFSVQFASNVSGTFTGTLTIGTRIFGLTGLAVVSPVPAMSIQLSATPLTSAEQVNVTVQASTAATASAIGELAMTFTPAVSGVEDDPAVEFVTTGGRNLQVNLASGSTSATYKGQSALAFQTGTTAGTITFTLTFPNMAPVTQSFTVTPALIHLTGAQAVRQSPNLVVTLDGYDNTYSAGQLGFTFYDQNGVALNSSPMAVNTSSNFHSYFFTNNQAGGAFTLQASFPVTGDDTKIGSVSVTLTNSAGQTSTKLSFQ